jgi:phage terminase small subunit
MITKKKIREYLEENGVYSSAYDYGIDLLIDQVKLYRVARDTIAAEGVTVPGNAEGTFFVRNQQLRTLSECITNIRNLSKSLGLSVSDSIIFKELTAGEDDGFDDGPGSKGNEGEE